jgi:methyl-accepting chemotaxis protein
VLKNMKIGLRLGIGFGVVLSLTVVIMLLGLYQMGQIDDKLNKIVTMNNVKLELANKAARAILNITNNLRLTNDSDIMLAQKNKIEAERNVYRDAMAKMKEIEKTKEGVEDIKKIEDIIAPAKAANDKFIELRLANRTAEAAEVLMKDAIPLTQKISDEFDRLIKFQEQRNQTRYEEAKQTYGNARLLMVIVGMVAIAIGITISIIITRLITLPLGKSVILAEAIAGGDLSCEYLDIHSRDEVGILAEALNKMKKSLSDVIGKFSDTASHVASSSVELSATVMQITKRVDEQANKANQVAAATTEMSQTVLDIAKNSSDIASSSQGTLKTAEDGAAVVSKTVEEVQEIAETVEDLARMMTSLGERSKEIGDILSVIRDIADQTNLLALNAAIEAARAGEQGRGFAVVADEVRKLAEKTAHSTSEIGGMIKAIQEETEKAVESMGEGTRKVASGVKLATQAGGALNDIVSSVNGLQAMVQQIASATEEMSTVSEQISSDIEVIANVSRETSSGSTQIAQEADNLSKISSDLRNDVSHFKIMDKGSR